MISSRKIFHTGCGEQPFEILCNNSDAYSIAEFLFQDFPGTVSTVLPIQYDILSIGKKPIFSLWDGEKRLYFGTSKYQLAYALMNEVIFHCINNNDKHHAIHAGAVWKGDQCIVLPGVSGKGKSTITAWLVSKGYQYLTDELLFIDDAGYVIPLTRPVNLKVNETHVAWMIKEDGTNLESIISDCNGSMIPHRLLNPQYESKKPCVTHIIFPEYKKGVLPKCDELSPARSSLYMLQSHVNARNLPNNGVPALSNIARKCKAYKLVYGSFSDLEAIVADLSVDHVRV